MNAAADRALAADIEDAVRTVTGVCAVYRAGSSLTRATDAAARLLGGGDDDGSALVETDRVTGALSVRVAIGVQIAVGAADTARRTHAVIQTALDQHGESSAAVQLTVVHIENSPDACTPAS